jgi:DNA-binding CsgD family transcriptional regulator
VRRTEPDAEAPAPVAEPLGAIKFELAGRPCRIVCVDNLLPSHQDTPGTARMRQRYLPDEIAHFDLGAHRYALVLENEAVAEPTRLATEIHVLLTNRELQIVQLICGGLLTKQVSDRLRISEFTVRSYLKTIYCKLGVRSRGAMVYTYAQSVSRLKSDGPPRAAASRQTIPAGD